MVKEVKEPGDSRVVKEAGDSREAKEHKWQTGYKRVSIKVGDNRVVSSMEGKVSKAAGVSMAKDLANKEVKVSKVGDNRVVSSMDKASKETGEVKVDSNREDVTNTEINSREVSKPGVSSREVSKEAGVNRVVKEVKVAGVASKVVITLGVSREIRDGAKNDISYINQIYLYGWMKVS